MRLDEFAQHLGTRWFDREAAAAADRRSAQNRSPAVRAAADADRTFDKIEEITSASYLRSVNVQLASVRFLLVLLVVIELARLVLAWGRS
jgi:hypothetical protein